MQPLQTASSQPHPWLGRSIGDGDRYRLDQRLGGGGMGEVFLATDVRLGKPVAIKVLKESLTSDDDLDFRTRFEQECGICAALKSPHIVQVSDYGVTAEGYPFYVMEYLQGQTLDQLLANQPRLSVARTCNIIVQVCAGLQLAHAGVELWNAETGSHEHIKVIHRDLKPANIFLVPSALGELAKVIDFGIAKIHSLQAEYNDATRAFLGTCHYAPPEQFDARREVDERADIYSLGVILYEMLTGNDPFGFDFRKNRVTNNAWLSAHATKQPKPLRSQPNGEQLSPQLEAIVMRCLEKSPDARFPSVAALSEALQTISSKAPLNQSFRLPDPPTPPSPPPSPPPSSPKIHIQSHRNSSRLLLGSAALLAIALGLYAVPQIARLPLFTAANPITRLVEDNTRTLSLVSTLSGNAKPALAAVMSPNGQTLISGGNDQDAAGQFYPINVWDMKTEQVVRVLDGHLGPIHALSLSENGQLLASASGDKTIKIWDMSTGRLLQTLHGHTAPVWSVALSRDGQTLVSGGEDNAVIVWDLRTGASRKLLEHTQTVYSVALSPDGKTIASGSADKNVKLWDLATGELMQTLSQPGGHIDTVSSVVFSSNGQQLATASWDGRAKLWNAATGQLLQTFEGHSDRVTAVTFLNNRAIASASADKTIKIWDTQTGQPLQNIPAHSEAVISVAAQPADQTLISSSNDSTIKIWR
jgi:eukaryotic-like serine/threonine-protein kinase